jgi:hypothetical protein
MRLFPNTFCHSERSEESSEMFHAESFWILRCAQDDNLSLRIQSYSLTP